MNNKTTVQVLIYSLNNKTTIDKPIYKVCTQAKIELTPAHFATISSLQTAISECTRAGFLRSQFFRISLLNLFPDEFLSDTETLQRYMNGGDVIPEVLHNLVVVRYTKAQCNQLRNKVTCEELFFLDNILRIKRKYTRVSMILASNPATAAPAAAQNPSTLKLVSPALEESKCAMETTASSLVDCYNNLMPEQRAQVLGCAATVVDATAERPQSFDDALIDLKRVCGAQYFRPYSFPVIERATALYKAGIYPLSKILKAMASNHNLQHIIGGVTCKRHYGVPTVSMEVPLDLVDDVNAFLGRKMLQRNLATEQVIGV